MKYAIVRALRVFIVCAGIIAFGCSKRVPQYTICMKNESAGTVEVRVLFGTTLVEGTYLPSGKPAGKALVPGGLAFDHGVRLPVPDKARIVWKTEDGKEHEQEVEVKRLIPSRMDDVTI